MYGSLNIAVSYGTNMFVLDMSSSRMNIRMLNFII